MVPTLNDTMDHVEERLRREFPDVRLEFGRILYQEHAEVWVNVLKPDEYARVKEKCRSIAKEEKLDSMSPEIWIFARPWDAPWPPGESIETIRARREEFLKRHPIYFHRTGQ